MNMCDPLSVAVRKFTVNRAVQILPKIWKWSSSQQSYSARWFNNWRKLEVWENVNYLDNVNRH